MYIYSLILTGITVNYSADKTDNVGMVSHFFGKEIDFSFHHQQVFFIVTTFKDIFEMYFDFEIKLLHKCIFIRNHLLGVLLLLLRVLAMTFCFALMLWGRYRAL